MDGSIQLVKKLSSSWSEKSQTADIMLSSLQHWFPVKWILILGNIGRDQTRRIGWVINQFQVTAFIETNDWTIVLIKQDSFFQFAWAFGSESLS